jgi:hypothetical protein
MIRHIFRPIFSAGKWSTLKTIGNSYISVVTILVPIFGYVIFSSSLGFTALTNALEIAADWGLTAPELKDGGLLRLKMSYVGLSIVGYSTIAFQILCPGEVKAYSDSRAFTLDANSVAHDEGIQDIVNKLSEGVWYHSLLHPSMDTTVSISTHYDGSAPSIRAREKKDKPKLNRSVWFEKNLDQLNKAHQLIFDWKDHSWFPVRWLILAGFLCGYILTVIPSIQMLAGPFLDVFSAIPSLWEDSQ